MSDPNETIADIVREIRAAAYIQNADTPESVIAFADRIEAAVARERNAHINDVHDALYMATGIPGNAAAMREALEQCGRALEKAQCSSAFQAANAGASYIAAALSSAHAALAAPARNCDRHASIGAAIDGFCREVQDWEDHDGIPDYYELAKWLFAPAEGGAE